MVKYWCMAEYLSWLEGPAHTRYVDSSSLPSATIPKPAKAGFFIPLSSPLTLELIIRLRIYNAENNSYYRGSFYYGML